MDKLISAIAVSLLLMGAACSSNEAGKADNPGVTQSAQEQHATPTGDCFERLSNQEASSMGESQCADPYATPGTVRAVTH